MIKKQTNYILIYNLQLQFQKLPFYVLIKKPKIKELPFYDELNI